MSSRSRHTSSRAAASPVKSRRHTSDAEESDSRSKKSNKRADTKSARAQVQLIDDDEEEETKEPDVEAEQDQSMPDLEKEDEEELVEGEKRGRFDHDESFLDDDVLTRALESAKAVPLPTPPVKSIPQKQPVTQTTPGKRSASDANLTPAPTPSSGEDLPDLFEESLEMDKLFGHNLHVENEIVKNAVVIYNPYTIKNEGKDDFEGANLKIVGADGKKFQQRFLKMGFANLALIGPPGEVEMWNSSPHGNISAFKNQTGKFPPQKISACKSGFTYTNRHIGDEKYIDHDEYKKRTTAACARLFKEAATAAYEREHKDDIREKDEDGNEIIPDIPADVGKWTQTEPLTDSQIAALPKEVTSGRTSKPVNAFFDRIVNFQEKILFKPWIDRIRSAMASQVNNIIPESAWVLPKDPTEKKPKDVVDHNCRAIYYGVKGEWKPTDGPFPIRMNKFFESRCRGKMHSCVKKDTRDNGIRTLTCNRDVFNKIYDRNYKKGVDPYDGVLFPNADIEAICRDNKLLPNRLPTYRKPTQEEIDADPNVLLTLIDEKDAYITVTKVNQGRNIAEPVLSFKVMYVGGKLIVSANLEAAIYDGPAPKREYSKAVYELPEVILPPEKKMRRAVFRGDMIDITKDLKDEFDAAGIQEALTYKVKEEQKDAGSAVVPK